MSWEISGGTRSGALNELVLWLAQGIGGSYQGLVLGQLLVAQYRGLLSGAGIGSKYRGQVLGAANQGPSWFKAADFVPPEILHDIPLLFSKHLRSQSSLNNVWVYTSVLISVFRREKNLYSDLWFQRYNANQVYFLGTPCMCMCMCMCACVHVHTCMC